MKYVSCDKAFAHVLLPDGTRLSRQIVTFDVDGCAIAIRPLCAEEPFVEWHDETFRYKP